MIEHHLRVKGLEGTSGFLPNTPFILLILTGDLFVDEDNSADLSPGDTIRYTVQIVNGGQVATTSVEFTDTPDINTTLVVGSVTTTQGTVTSGNAGDETTIAIDVGQIDGQGAVTINYEVVVAMVFPPNVNTVSNQGEVTSDELPPEPTDDPPTAADDDPTVLAIFGLPMAIPVNSLWMLILMLSLMLVLGAHYRHRA